MEDILQPVPGDEVQIYLDPAAPAAHTHATTCGVVDVLADDLDVQTDRPTDAYFYRLKELETDETLPLAFRHYDLVPTEPTQ